MVLRDLALREQKVERGKTALTGAYAKFRLLRARTFDRVRNERLRLFCIRPLASMVTASSSIPVGAFLRTFDGDLQSSP
jgi:hypothetical protein